MPAPGTPPARLSGFFEQAAIDSAAISAKVSFMLRAPLRNIIPYSSEDRRAALGRRTTAPS